MSTGHAVSLAPLLPYAYMFVGLVVVGLGAYFSRNFNAFVQAKTGALSQSTRDAIETAGDKLIQEGTTYAYHLLTDEMQKNMSSVQVNSWIAQTAGQFFVDHAPDHLQDWLGGNTPNEAVQRAAQKVLSKLPNLKVQ